MYCECDRLCITVFASLYARRWRPTRARNEGVEKEMRGNEDPGFERSALCNLTHASFVHASWRNRKRHQPVILHHHRESASSLVQHRHPGTPKDHTLSGSQAARQVRFAFSSTQLVETCWPPAITTFRIKNGVNATALTLLVEPGPHV